MDPECIPDPVSLMQKVLNPIRVHDTAYMRPGVLLFYTFTFNIDFESELKVEMKSAVFLVLK